MEEKDIKLDDIEGIMRTMILRHWSRERLERFCKHLLGDKCQACEKPEENGGKKGAEKPSDPRDSHI